MKAAFSNFSLPGCDISQRNEVEKSSSSFESFQPLIPTAVLMARDRRFLLPFEESLLAEDVFFLISDQGKAGGKGPHYV